MTILTLWAATIVFGLCLLGYSGSHALQARAAAVDSKTELRTVSTQATELVLLRAAGREVPVRPEGGLAGKVAAAMARAGLASSILQGLSPEAQTPLTGDNGIRLMRQRATLSLANISLPQVGKFLDAWRTAEPDWIISGVDLSPMTTTGAALGTDLALRAVIAIEGVFQEPTRDPFIGVSR